MLKAVVQTILPAQKLMLLRLMMYIVQIVTENLDLVCVPTSSVNDVLDLVPSTHSSIDEENDIEVPQKKSRCLIISSSSSDEDSGPSEGINNNFILKPKKTFTRKRWSPLVNRSSKEKNVLHTKWKYCSSFSRPCRQG